MKTPIQGTPFVPLILLLLVLGLSSCSDEDLEPIGGVPVEEEALDEQEEEVVEDIPEGDLNPILRLNCGGEEIGYGDTVFTEDNFFEGNTMDFANTAVADVFETEMDELYINQRTSIAAEDGFEYKIPITNGTYTLKLHFAELFYGAPDGAAGNSNARVFTIEVEGEILLEEFDIFNEVGSLTALIKEFELTIVDQELNIRASASKDKPLLAAIEVLGDGEILNP